MEYWSVAAHFQHSSTPTLQYSEGLFYEAQGVPRSRTMLLSYYRGTIGIL
jgi:hypothetical protein